MDVLFLDIDGVLNHPSTKERCGFYRGVDRELSERLLGWLRGANVKTVLSSTWRLHQEMHKHLRDAGIYWISATPSMPSGGRGDEIECWLKWHKGAGIKRYAILDDISEFLTHQQPFHVQTDEMVGLQHEHIERLKQLFAAEAVHSPKLTESDV